MVERRQDLAWDLPPWHHNCTDYTQAFLARRNTARGLQDWDPKRFLQPVKPKPLLQPIGEEEVAEQSQHTRDVKSPQVGSFARDQESPSSWSGTTLAPTSSDNLTQVTGESVCETSACSKCHKWRKLGQPFRPMKSGCRAEAPQEEIDMDKTWSGTIQVLASRLENIMNLAKQNHNASELKSALKAFKDLPYRQDLAEKHELTKIPAIPKLSNFSEKSQLQEYLNPEPEAPITHGLPAYSDYSDITKTRISVEPPAVERESSADAGVLTQDSNIPKTIRSSGTSGLQGSPKVDTRDPISAGYRLSKPILPTAQLQTKMPENGWSQDQLAESAIQVLQQESQILQQEKACMLEEIGLLPKNTAPELEKKSNRLPNENATRNPELEIAQAFRQQALVRQNFEEEMAALKAQQELDSLVAQKAISKRELELDVLSQGERQRQLVPKTHTMPKSRMLSLRELNGAPMKSEAFTGLEKATTPNPESNVDEGLRTDLNGHKPFLKTHTLHTKQTRTANAHERLATAPSFRALLELKQRATDGAHTSFCSRDPYHLSQSFEQLEEQPTEGAPTFQHAVYIDHAGTKRKTDSKEASGRPSIQAQSGFISPIRRNAKRGQHEDNGGSDDEYNNSDDGNPKRRKEIPPKSTPPQRGLACPYSKHNIGRYSQRNLKEKQYCGCSKCLFPDVSRLKQHLYRVHQRPENHCIRCFQVFSSSESLDQHAQQTVSCRVQRCPFPEKFTSDQTKQLRKKWMGKSAKECWYNIFRILFPLGQPPSSPYADEFHLPSPDAPQMLRQIVLERLRQHRHSPTTVQLMSDEAQDLLGQTIEDSLAELFRRLTPATNSNVQSGSSALDGNASDDYGSGVHDSDDHELNVPGMGSDQVVEDQCHTTQHGSEDAIDLPTTSTENYSKLPASNARPIYYENSSVGDIAHLDSGEYGLFNSSFNQPGKHGNEKSRRGAKNLSAVPHQLLNPCEAPSNYTSSSLQSSVSAPATQSRYSALCLNNTQQTWSGASSASYIPMSEFVAPSLPATTFDSEELYLSTNAGCCSQQPPQKRLEPSIYSFDSGYESMHFPQESHSSLGWPSENVTIPEPGRHDTVAESWGPNDRDEAEFVEGVGKPSRMFAFAESRASHHPAATF